MLVVFSAGYLKTRRPISAAIKIMKYNLSVIGLPLRGNIDDRWSIIKVNSFVFPVKIRNNSACYSLRGWYMAFKVFRFMGFSVWR
jgi:hypothetical protein